MIQYSGMASETAILLALAIRQGPKTKRRCK